ncbi:TIGR03905 family TSCPD domain-containing protein [bacterium]|nr:TIGR03905 family TSCPD domain-containing protein [bacterium]
MNNLKTIEYQTTGTCCQLMRVTVDENNIIQDSEFYGGCNGNLQGIKTLIKGMNIDEVISKLKGISCNGKPTSCPDQLATCLMMYKEQNIQKV